MKRQKKDKGAVLLTTLLIMSLMSAVAVAMMDEVRVAILRSGNMKAHAQAEWHLKAAEEFARGYLEENFLPLTAVEKNIALRKPLETVMEIEGGIITLSVMDGSQCISLSNLAPVDVGETENPDGEGNSETPGMAEALTNLMEDLGMPQLETAGLVAAIQDWQDEDEQISDGGAEDYTYLARTPPYRTANAPMYSLEELRAIRGMSEEILKLIRPFVCAGDPQRKGVVNINTLQLYHLPMLSAMLGADEDNLAAEILQNRPLDGYKDLAKDLESTGVDTARIQNGMFTYEPDYLWIEMEVSFGNAKRSVLLEFKVDSESLTRTYRHYGTEGRRPKPEDFQGEQEQDNP